jgi:phenylalanyl-tRNA synthetase beta chain
VRSFTPNAQHELEQGSLRQWCAGLGCSEIHGYLWYDAEWCKRLGFVTGACVELRNPIAAGMHQLRKTLMPGMLAAVEQNRHHLSAFKLIEVGGVFAPGPNGDRERRHLAVVFAQRGKGAEDALLADLRGAIETWSWQTLDRPASFRRSKADAGRPWEHEQKTGEVVVDGTACGLLSALPLGLRRAIDEHLLPWSAAWAELDLSLLAKLAPTALQLQDVPDYPQKDLDFTAVVAADRGYEQVAAQVAQFEHPLLLRVTYVTSYEGRSLGEGKRSLTFRARLGSDDRTLVDDDLVDFREAFERHLVACGLELRGAGKGG